MSELKRKQSAETRIIRALIEDIESRKGLSHMWASIDPAVRVEIRRSWRKILTRELQAAGKDGVR